MKCLLKSLAQIRVLNFGSHRYNLDIRVALNPQGSKYPNARYLPQTRTTITSIDTLHTIYLSTLDP